MPVLRDTPGAGHYLLSEAEGSRSRDRIRVGASQTLKAGRVLAALGLGDGVATPGTPVGPGNGAVGAWTVDAGAPAGRWLIRLLATGATAAYAVYRPDGSQDGQGAVGTAYNGGINGTLADGATDWSVGAEIPIVVTYPDGEVFVSHDPAGTNGSQYPRGILFDDVTTGVGETVAAVAHVRDCQVSELALGWGAHSAPQKLVAVAALARAGVIARH